LEDYVDAEIIAANASIDSRVSREEEERADADASLETVIGANLTAMNTADTSLETVISSNLVAMNNADDSLETVISSNLVAMNNADDSLESVISSNLVAMNSKDNALSAEISECCSIHTAADTSIEGLISVEISNRVSGDLSLSSSITEAKESINGKISTEITDRQSADTSLANAIEDEKERIDAILEGSDVDLDQFAEIVSFVNGIDLENDAALLNAVTSIGLAIDDVEDAMESADGSLATALSAAELDLNGKINTEASSRVSADGSLETVIATNRTDANTAISAEESARVAADNSINSRLTTEETARFDGDKIIRDELDLAVTNLQAEDVRLAGLIDAERDRALAAEEALEEALAAEVANLISNTDLTAIDSFSEVVAELGAITEEFNNTYFKKVTVSGLVNGTNKNFTLAFEVRPDSEAIYYNGLLQEEGVDYNINGVNVDFTYFPAAGGKVTAYGVYA
jgi:hypothetical protein